MSLELLRILDVCLNRGREALRVLEDYARFVRDDRDAAASLKTQRHALQQVADRLGVERLLRARDILHDVGRETRAVAELERADAAAVARAALGRAGESLRGVAEYSKGLDSEAAQATERIRYAVYELEQRLMLRGDLRQRMRDVRLYVIITESLCRQSWETTAEAALRGGAECLQLREKTLADRELLDRARRLREITRQFDALLILNDRPDIARLAMADGVHVGQDDLSVQSVRRIAGADLLVGKSTHTPAQLDSAVEELPDYIAVGPMFATSTKPQDHIAGPHALRAAATRTELPLVAIGGITDARAAEVLSAAPACLCVCSAVIASDDPRGAAERIVEIIKSRSSPAPRPDR